MHIRIILEFFEKYKCPSIAFILQSSRCVSYEHPCLKTTGLYDGFLLLSSVLLFLFHIVLPFHLVSDAFGFALALNPIFFAPLPPPYFFLYVSLSLYLHLAHSSLFVSLNTY